MNQVLKLEICTLLQIADNLHYVNQHYKMAAIDPVEKKFIMNLNKVIEEYRISKNLMG